MVTEKMGAKSTDCLICNSRIGPSSRNSVQIFDENSKTGTEKPVLETIQTIIEENIVETTSHSVVLCKKCYKLLNEVLLFILSTAAAAAIPFYNLITNKKYYITV